MKPGIMIVCDGSNGAGKTTVIETLVQHIKSKGRDVIVTREPGGTPIGEKIREVILCPDTPEMCDMTELMLFAAARAQHVKEKILPALAQGKVIVSDRFDSATISFQHYARGLDLALIKQLNDLALDGFSPNKTIVLDLDPEIGLQRVHNRGEGLDRLEDQELAFLTRARNGYLAQASDNPDKFHVVDASKSKEEVAAEVLETVDKLLADN